MNRRRRRRKRMDRTTTEVTVKTAFKREKKNKERN
jgi:hypothetical protein